MKIPSEAIKQYLIGAVVPAVAGAAAAYLASKGVLNIFDISNATATTDIDELGVFVVVAGSGWLTSHHILSGRYSPTSKARGGSARLVVNGGGGGGVHVGAGGEIPSKLFAPGTIPTGVVANAPTGNAPQPPRGVSGDEAAIRMALEPIVQAAFRSEQDPATNIHEIALAVAEHLLKVPVASMAQGASKPADEGMGVV